MANQEVKQEPVIVIGGGAAGILAAYRAAQCGASVLLLEKKSRLGTKILISGGGKCNVTHDGPIEDVLKPFRPHEARFLRPSFYRFTNEQFVQMLTDKNLPTYTRPDGRIFPVPPADAKDVADALAAHLGDVGVRVRLNAPVKNLAADIVADRGAGTEGRLSVTLDWGEVLHSRQVIVAVGGSSYPATGTTGDGWPWLAALGHTVLPLRAALAPLYLDPTPPADWSGVALRDCVLRARRVGESGNGNVNTPGKELMRWRGDLLWTHKGVSGPTALGVSREVAEIIPAKSMVEVDTLPDRTAEDVNTDLLTHCRTHPRRSIADYVGTIVPQRLVQPLMASAQVAPDTKGAYLAQKERVRLVQALKGWSLGVVRHVPLERGEVVAGGVSLAEVDNKTMRSTKVPGLFLCGEILDIAGPVGGYNLQAAWSTGYVAGESAAREWLAQANNNE